MPEAALHLNDGAVLRKHYVRATRKTSGVQPEAVAQSVECSSDQKLGLRINRADSKLRNLGELIASSHRRASLDCVR